METLEILSPYDGKCISELNLVGAAELETMLSTAHRLFSDRSCWIPKSERLNILRKAAGLIREQRESLAVQAASEGKAAG